MGWQIFLYLIRETLVTLSGEGVSPLRPESVSLSVQNKGKLVSSAVERMPSPP